jgi:hypothetical protein
MYNSRDRLHLRAYMLRFWAVHTQEPECQAVWRFSLEDPHTGDRFGFADLNALIAFLEAELGRSKES